MTVEERKQDILNSSLFLDNEVEQVQNDSNFHVFKSWEYYQIFHLTNEEHYYTSEEEVNNLSGHADEIIDTNKGIIYCFK